MGPRFHLYSDNAVVVDVELGFVQSALELVIRGFPHRETVALEDLNPSVAIVDDGCEELGATTLAATSVVEVLAVAVSDVNIARL